MVVTMKSEWLRARRNRSKKHSKSALLRISEPNFAVISHETPLRNGFFDDEDYENYSVSSFSEFLVNCTQSVWHTITFKPDKTDTDRVFHYLLNNGEIGTGNYINIVDNKKTDRQKTGALGELFLFAMFKIYHSEELQEVSNPGELLVYQHAIEDGDPIDLIFILQNTLFINCVKATTKERNTLKSSGTFFDVYDLTKADINDLEEKRGIMLNVVTNRVRFSNIDLKNYTEKGLNPFDALEMFVNVRRSKSLSMHGEAHLSEVYRVAEGSRKSRRLML